MSTVDTAHPQGPAAASRAAGAPGDLEAGDVPQQPAGTVTFLFTDIEGSTRLVQDLGAARYRGLLEDHHRLLREAVAVHHGYEFGTEGDAMFVAFDRAGQAVLAARDAQRALAAHRWPQGRAVRVRMGVHTAEATATGGGYVGLGVHRAARICAAGHGGQVLLSSTTASLVRDEGVAVVLLPLGEHRLKDVEQPQRLYQILDPLLPSVFPPLRAVEHRSTNIPTAVQPILGRDREAAVIEQLLLRAEVRLVTLTGPGGTGKTRLAFHVGLRMLPHFRDGVFVVALSEIKDPDLVRPAIAQTLGLTEAAGQSVSAYLRDKQLLLVVDNFEQVAAAAPELAQLVGQAPDVTFLATSREPLRVTGEHLFPVPPLGLPDPRDAVDLAQLAQNAAVSLFVQRAQAVDPAFRLTRGNAPAVAEICARLDGLPLAIELAAVRIRLLSPEAMLTRLDARLELLTSGARDVPARQRTLRGALAWSYDLLAPAEQAAFARLGVFAGGWSLDAAAAVCEVDLDTLAALVDKNLVGHKGERFEMLHTVREYACELLAATSDGDMTQDRHAAFYLALAEDAHASRFTHEKACLDELEQERDNLRAALDRLAVIDAVRYLDMTGALGWFWLAHSHLAEGRARLAHALAGAPAAGAVRARALGAAGALAAWQGDLDSAQPLLAQAVSIWRELDRDAELALTLYDLGWAAFFAGDDPTARRHMEESLALERALERPVVENRARLGLAQVLVSMGEVEIVEGLATEALAVAQRLDDRRSEHFAHHYLADCALLAEDFITAEALYLRSLQDVWQTGDQIESAFELQGLAMAVAGRGDAARALQLLGAADGRLRSLGVELSVPFWDRLLHRFEQRAREALGAAAAAAFTEGGRLPFERVVHEAIEVGPSGR